MKNKFLKGLSVIGLSALLFVSCGKMPQVEMDAAKAAIESAKTAGAEIYAQESFVALQDSMNAVLSAIEAQNSKLFKNYSASIAGLAKVNVLAADVKLEAETKKEALKAEILSTIAQVKASIESSNALLLEAPKGKEGASALEAIKGELSSIESSLTESSTLLESGELNASLDKASAANTKATSINTELQDVIAKYQKTGKPKKA